MNNDPGNESPLTTSSIEDGVDINLPSSTSSHLEELARRANITEDFKDDEYTDSVLKSSRLVTSGDVWAGHDDTSSSIDHEGHSLRSYNHKASIATGKAVTGRQARIRAMGAIGGGLPTPTLLPHSGFWVTYLPPAEPELMMLWAKITSDRISLGRFTYGAIFSSTSIVTRQRILEFCLDYIESTSVELGDESLLEHISILDEPLMLNGLGMAIHPNGINYKMPCVANPSNCQHVSEGKLAPSKLQRYCNDRLTDEQKTILTQTSRHSTTLSQVKDYQTKLVGGGVKVSIDVDGNTLTFTILAPSIAKAIRMGGLWITQIHDSVIDALSEDNDVEENDEDTWSRRDSLITRRGQASFLGQYAAWVSAIDMGDNGYVDTEEDVLSTLNVLSGATTVREELIDVINKYIDDKTIAIIGLPAYTCPSCNESPSGTNKGIIPLDPTRLFLQYLAAKVTRIDQRYLI